MRNDVKLILLDKHQVEALLKPDDVVEAVREAFALHSAGEGRVFPVVREALVTGGVFGIKSGDVQSQGLLGFKAAGFWPANRGVGGEPHQATIMLIDPKTGRPVCVIDGNAITTMRTGAAGALGLTLFARADSTRLCVFGTGVQARVQVTFALRVLKQLSSIRYVTVDAQRDASFEAHFTGHCEVSHATDHNAAVAESDVVITATPGFGPLFNAAAVRPGTHLNCVGADTKGKRELPEGLLMRSRVFVDDRSQAREIGETQWAPGTVSIEIGDVITGRVQTNRQPDDITLFDMTGIALQDLTVARLLHQRACETSTATSLAWPW
ncbi:ornithine cyclodeaminase family protein [Paraburkholderia sp. 32]|uniref:ornithine cyclodeaminase family protein n=1 Tax=Paraburkholderia sp. 32 TaxID=2991057 RepID=UPI003D1D4A6D